jgi:uncharacterized membrane protein YoaK (UPF0700 family)
MLRGNQSISHYTSSNITIWLVMAFQAGFLNIGGFLSCHRFISHVTGAWTMVGYELNGGNFSSVLGVLATPLFLLAGAMLSGQLVDVRLRTQKQPRYYEVYGLMFVLITGILVCGILGVFGSFGEPLALARDYVLVFLLSFICGLQNGTITSVSRVVIRTSHLTGLTTDLGLGLARLLNRHRIQGDSFEEVRANLMRVGLIFFFIAGAAAGGFVFPRWEFSGFAIPVFISGTLFSLMLYFQVLKSGDVPKGAA